jgi:hypothetical protein
MHVDPTTPCDRCGHPARVHSALLGECEMCVCLEFAEADTIQALIAECDQLQDLLQQANQKCAALFTENAKLREAIAEDRHTIARQQDELRRRIAQQDPMPIRPYGRNYARPSSGGLDGHD